MIINMVVDDVEDKELVEWLNYQGKHYPGVRNRSAFMRLVLYEKMRKNDENYVIFNKKFEKNNEIDDNLFESIEGLE
jgi:hypothetical protein